ncbi:putative secreted protein with PEP-CTERM sorting signal [Nitrosospira multiformis]|uniref:Putative secreted protein with PEP-CTERM sorting signal n=1 Tax=Nitrosospira multiformis TaxID=1231 RepID=A0A2T5I1E7_9PROT|nr:PEP-CTERM sorting domain-containing protein [Nitrosospira multiformis]PTQ77651.1 putative secreted protein with PEP-CTERM sorting signal [Nitrosospira multiformis]
MTLSQCFRARHLILAAVLTTSLGLVNVANAQQQSFLVDLSSRTATPLGTLGATFTTATTPLGINDAGQVVGLSYTANNVQRAFITGPGGMGMRDIGTLEGERGYSTAEDINDAGQVVGSSSFGGFGVRAFITGPGGTGMRDLGTLSENEHLSHAYGINRAGQVVGISTQGGFASHAFITGSDGVGMRDLGITLLGEDSKVTGINDVGQVIGNSHSGTSYATRAFITGPDGMGMIDLGTLGGDETKAWGINDVGQVAGYSTTASGASHAFITGPNGVGMTDLGTLGGWSSYAHGINDAGQVVGQSVMKWPYPDAGTGLHAFITGSNGVGMTDLNSLVELPAGVVLTDAVDINNAGQVLVNATTAVPAIPEPQSYALLLAGLTLFGFMAARNGKVLDSRQ